MRTTVTLDPDVEALLRRAIKERGISFKEALNQALRVGLSQRGTKEPRKFCQKTYHMGFNPQIDLDHALSLASAMEDGVILRKLSSPK